MIPRTDGAAPAPVNLLALMKRIEHHGLDHIYPECPECSELKPSHEKDCELMAAIRFLQWEEDETKALEAALAETSKRAQPIKQKDGRPHETTNRQMLQGSIRSLPRPNQTLWVLYPGRAWICFSSRWPIFMAGD